MAAKPKQATTGPKLWVVLARAYGSLASYVEHSIAKEGICLSDFMVLEVLLHKGAMTISAIGEKVLLAAPSMTSANCKAAISASWSNSSREILL